MKTAIDLFEKARTHDRVEQLRAAREQDLMPYFRLLEGQAGQIQRLEKAVRVLHATDKRQDASMRSTVRHVGLLRYDAFEDVGGRLSFSCALLDDRGNGVVVTSINGRQETRVYAKPVTAGASSYNLSTEEQEAIRQALEAPAQETVEAR